VSSRRRPSGRCRSRSRGCCAWRRSWTSLRCWPRSGLRTSLRSRRCALWLRRALLLHGPLLGLGCCSLLYGTLLLRSGTLRFYGALWLLLRCCALRFHGALLLLRSDGAVRFRCTLLLWFNTALGLGCTVRLDPTLLLRSYPGTLFWSSGALLLGLNVVLLDGDAALLLLPDGRGSFRDVRCTGGSACRTGKGSLGGTAVVGVVELRPIL